MALSDRHERFAQEYAIDFNASRAAIRAGYAISGAGVEGHRLLKNAKIYSRVEELKQEVIARLDISKERILREYAKIAFTNLEDVTDWLNGDPKLLASNEIDPIAHGAISEVTRTETVSGGITVKVKLHDKRPALDALAKYNGMFVDKVEHSGTLKTETVFWVEFDKVRTDES